MPKIITSALLIVFITPLILGGWILPKSLSQFRNPLIFLFILALTAGVAFRKRIRLDPVRLTPLLLAIYLFAFLKSAFHDYAAFSLNAIDFSMYDFAMMNTLRGEFMQTITGVNHFGIHATPILFLFLPLHALFHSPLFALALHPLLLWSAVLALDSLVRSAGITGWARLGILFSYLNCVIVSQTLHYGFHVESAYPLFGFLLFAAIKTRRTLYIFGALLLFLSIKEDAPFYAMGILLAAATTQKIKKRETLLCVAVAALAAVFYLRILIPSNSPTSSYSLVGAAAAFGRTPLGALEGVLQDPLEFVRKFFHGGWWPLVVPSLGLLFRSPHFWIASLPFFAISTLAGGPLLLGLALYYGMPFVPVLFSGWIDGYTRENSTYKKNVSLTIAILGTTLFGGGYLVFREVDFARFSSIAAIRGAIRPDSKVCAPGVLVPHLGYPKKMGLLEKNCIATADTVVTFDPESLQRGLSPYPSSSEDFLKIVHEVENWPVLLRSGEFTLRSRP